MRNLRTGNPRPERWDTADVMAYLGCDKPTAKKIMEDCRRKHGIGGYGPIEKQLILDFIEEKQRAAREREARHNSDLANVEIQTTLREQVKVLRTQVDTLTRMSDASSEDARKARTQSLIANFISLISAAIAILALVLR